MEGTDPKVIQFKDQNQLNLVQEVSVPVNKFSTSFIITIKYF